MYMHSYICSHIFTEIQFYWTNENYYKGRAQWRALMTILYHMYQMFKLMIW